MTTIPRKIFVNIYSPFAAQVGTAYETKELADQMAARGRLACIEVMIGWHGTKDVMDRLKAAQ